MNKKETRGRKPLYDTPMDNKERQSRWRERRRIEKERSESKIRVGMIKDWDEATCLMILTAARFQVESEEGSGIDLPLVAWRRLGELRGYTTED